MIERAVKGLTNEGLFSELAPIPKELSDTVSGRLGDTEEQRQLELREEANLAKYGYKNWYDYCVNEWGTKWDVTADNYTVEEGGLAVSAGFDSAWSPPIGGYDKLVDMGFRVYGMYFEPGCAFAGIYDNGYDDCYNLAGLSSSEMRDELPSELDGYFGISESQEEWELENEDEFVTWYREGVEELDKAEPTGQE